MKKALIKLGALIAIFVFMAAHLAMIDPVNLLDASSSTTYTQTYTLNGRTQDAYLPGSYFDRIGLSSPADIVIEKETINGVEREYAYILNNVSGSPYIVKLDVNNIKNDSSSVEIIDLSYLNGTAGGVKSISGLWIQTLEDGTRNMYLASRDSTYTVSKTSFTGLIYVVDMSTIVKNVPPQASQIFHRPSTPCPVYNYDNPELNVCTEGQEFMTEPSFGNDTQFTPEKVAVNERGNIFIASSSTSAGIIQLSRTGKFASFFVVNQTYATNLYKFIKKWGSDEQLANLPLSERPTTLGFSNVYVDSEQLVYSMTAASASLVSKAFDKHNTMGSSLLATTPLWNQRVVNSVQNTMKDLVVNADGLIFAAFGLGEIAVYEPDGSLIYLFGTSNKGSTLTVGFFDQLEALEVDSQNRIWALDSRRNILQSFTPTDYTNAIFTAISAFNNHDYELSRSSWEQAIKYDSLSRNANDGIGRAYYYDGDYKNAIKYFETAYNYELYSDCFWEIRNQWLQTNLTVILAIAVGVIALLVLMNYLFKRVPVLVNAKTNVAKINNKRWFKDLTVGFRMIKKPSDTFYEVKRHYRGSVLGATVYYILALIAFLLNLYGKSMPFPSLRVEYSNPLILAITFIGGLMVFALCNYLVSAIKNGEGKFVDIYKFLGYSLLPLIICFSVSTGISYILTLTESVIIDGLYMLGIYGSVFFVIMGILETHNLTFTQTIFNVIKTIIFIILFAIICIMLYVMFDQLVILIEGLWKEVKLRVGWY